MNTYAKLAVVAVLLAAVAGVVAVRRAARSPATRPAGTAAPVTASRPAGPLPRLIEFGAGRCRACQMMAPILAALKSEYAGRLEVESVDVFKDRQAADEHDIRIIPCQVFFDPAGKELYRHEGFFPRQDILKKWKELGFDLARPAP